MTNRDLNSRFMRSADKGNVEEDIPEEVPISTDKIRKGFESYLPESECCWFPSVVKLCADRYNSVNFRGYVEVNFWGFKYLGRCIAEGKNREANRFIETFSGRPYYWNVWVEAGILRIDESGKGSRKV